MAETRLEAEKRAGRALGARLAQLGERIGVLCANIDAAQAELVDALGEFDDLDGWHHDHAASAPHGPRARIQGPSARRRPGPAGPGG